jgi:hypothetical protein
VRICDLYSEIARIQKRIEKSEQVMQSARSTAPEAFSEWVHSAEIVDLLDEIKSLITHSQGTLNECLRIASTKRSEYNHELGQMGKGRQLFASITSHPSDPRFLDARQ